MDDATVDQIVAKATYEYCNEVYINCVEANIYYPLCRLKSTRRISIFHTNFYLYLCVSLSIYCKNIRTKTVKIVLRLLYLYSKIKCSFCFIFKSQSIFRLFRALWIHSIRGTLPFYSHLRTMVPEIDFLLLKFLHISTPTVLFKLAIID